MNYHNDVFITQEDIELYITEFNNETNDKRVVQFDIDDEVSVIACSTVNYHVDNVGDCDFTTLTPIWIGEPCAFFTDNGKYSLKVGESFSFNHNMSHALFREDVSFEFAKEHILPSSYSALNGYSVVESKEYDKDLVNKVFEKDNCILVAIITVHKNPTNQFFK